MANALAEIYSNSALIPIDRVIAILEAETSPKKLADFAKRVEAVKRIDTDNKERKSYWEILSVWSKKRVGQLTLEGKEKGEIAKQGITKSRKSLKGDHTPLCSLADLGLEKKYVREAEKLAAIPDEDIQTYVDSQKAAGKEVTLAGALRAAVKADPKPNGKPKPPPKKKEPAKPPIVVTEENGDPAKDDEEWPVDGLDDAVPDELRPVFQRGAEYKERINEINAIIRWIKDIAQHPAGSRLHAQSAENGLKAVKESLKFAQPYQSRCGYCQGDGSKCEACKGSGWLALFQYNALSDALKKKSEMLREKRRHAR